MLKKVFKWIGILIAGLLIVILAFYTTAYFNTESRMNKTYQVNLQQLTIPTDSASYALGKHVAEIRGCIGCHLATLEGHAFADEKSPLGILYSSNLTSGKGGINYTSDQDWIRVIRHGVNRENKSVWFMPSHEVYHISNQELAALICFLKAQPPVDKEHPKHELKPIGRILTFLDEIPMFPAELIDHNATYPETVALTTDATSGEYLATSCKGCHANDFKGAAAHSPEEPPIPNISSSGNLGKWTEAGFVELFHTGITPDGKVLSKYMPVKDFSYSDDELRAIFSYLHELR